MCPSVHRLIASIDSQKKENLLNYQKNSEQKKDVLDKRKGIWLKLYFGKQLFSARNVIFTMNNGFIISYIK